MNKSLTILLILLSFGRTFACINSETVVLKDRTRLFADDERDVPQGHSFSSQEEFRVGIKQLDSLYKATKDLAYLSDKGVLLILTKQYDEAIRLYFDIEKMQPGKYTTASNIGTAYELAGQNENALKWIKKAVAIDPESHKGSEWIHVNILEAKIKGESYYNADSLLGTDFGTELLPKSALSRAELRRLSTALFYQLNERVSFVAPKEKIVARLLFELGNIEFLLGHYDVAAGDYERARLYGFSEVAVVYRQGEANRRANIPKEVPRERINNRTIYMLYGGTAVAIAGIIMIIMFRRKDAGSSTQV